MEYIGATGTPITFDPVPIEDGIDFHFILGFAIDADPSGQTQNGTFSPYWVDTLTPASVAAIKAKHSNVKALASLSGWSRGQKVIRWYDPVEPQIWISNAFSSLQSIAIKYHLDGIDIDYENLPKHNSTFAYCIGELITMLKNQSAISIATIAPFYTTAIPYIELFKNYGSVMTMLTTNSILIRLAPQKGTWKPLSFELSNLIGISCCLAMKLMEEKFKGKHFLKPWIF